jgi:hypothetical protein
MAEAERTTAVEGLAFTVKDQASAPAEKMASAFERVHHATERVGERIKEFAHHTAMGALGAVGLGFGLHELADKAKEANLELEGAAKKIAGVHFAFGGWRSDISAAEKWTYALEEGKEVVDKLDASEFKLHKTRGELANVYKSAYAIGTRHNLNQQQMLDLTEKLAASETVLGVSAEFASTTIARGVMTGKFRGFDDFSKQLRFATGDMKKLSESARFEKIMKAMGDLVPAAVGMGGGMAGAMADIKIAVDNIVRDLTGPLFQEQSKSLREWAKNITKIREDGKSIAAEYGEKLVSAFHTLKDVTAWLYDHWKEIAAIWASAKFASWMGPGAGAAAGGGMAPAVTTVTGKLTTFAGKLSVATGALTDWYLLLEGGAAWLDKWQTKNIETTSRWGAGSALEGSSGKAAARHMEAFRGMLNGEGFQTDYKDAMAKAKEAFISYQAAYGTDVVGRSGVQRGQAMAAWETMTPEARAKQATGLGLASSATGEQFVNKLDEMVKLLAGLLPSVTDKAKGPHVARGGPPIINIAHATITQEFKESDPDRVFHKGINEIDHMVNTPRGATTNALGA